jgi:hypothetical protein
MSHPGVRVIAAYRWLAPAALADQHERVDVHLRTE